MKRKGEKKSLAGESWVAMDFKPLSCQVMLIIKGYICTDTKVHNKSLFHLPIWE